MGITNAKERLHVKELRQGGLYSRLLQSSQDLLQEKREIELNLEGRRAFKYWGELVQKS